MSLWHEIGARAQPHFSQGTGMVDLTVRNLKPLFPQVHWTSFYCVIAKVRTAVVVKGKKYEYK